MRQNLHSDNLQILLDIFRQKARFLNRTDNPELVSKIVVKWTQGQTLLTKKLLQYILQSKVKINEGEEADAVENIVRNYLLKEFKKDDLTLSIRKRLYQKDLERLVAIKGNDLLDLDRSYLLQIQRNLGLTEQQTQSINARKLTLSSYVALKTRSNLVSQRNRIDYPTRDEATDSGAIEPLKIYEKSDLIHQPFLDSAITSQAAKPERKNRLLLLFSIPLLLLLFQNLERFRQEGLATGSNPNLEQQKLCVDLTSRNSSRMSLGEKLLRNNSQLNTVGAIASYEGMAAFARCEFTVAQNKYQKSLEINKNNPEALIYRNNAEAIAKPHFKIAVSIPLGSKPDIAWEILRGVAQAQTDINQHEGLNNKLLLVQIVNDDNDPDVVKQLAQELSADKNILAVVGHNDSNSSIAGAEIYEREKLVMISPTSTSTKLSGMGSHIMRTVPSVSALASKLASYAAAESLTKIAVCSDSQDSASSSFVSEFVDRTTTKGGQIVKINCDFAEEDFQPDSIVDRAVTANVDALLITPSVSKMDKAIAVARANQQQLPLLGNHSLYNHKTIELGGDAIAGMVIPSPWLSSTVDNDFPQVAMQYWGGQVNWRTAMAYDAVEAIAQGLKQSNNRQELQLALTQPDFSVDGATGKFKFEQGDRYRTDRVSPYQTIFWQERSVSVFSFRTLSWEISFHTSNISVLACIEYLLLLSDKKPPDC